MPILRPCSGALATALAAGNIPFKADLFTWTNQGVTTRYTDWDKDLTVGGSPFASANPWLRRGRWRVVNTMEVPTLEIVLDSLDTALKRLIHNGFLDGATFLLQRVFMPTAGDTTTYGTIDLFSGDSGAVKLDKGIEATIKVRGKNSRLNVPAPVNVYQPGCIHTFCDPGCTLSAATFTTSRIAGSSPANTRTSVTSTTTLPTAGPGLKGGTLTMTSGATSGQIRSIIQNTATVVTLAYPLTAAPAPGDHFTVFQGCDKTLVTCNTIYSNKVNFRGFPFIPPPSSTGVG